MKKLFAIILLISLVSCSSDESKNESTSFNPPDWIKGSWYLQLDDMVADYGYKFTNEDFCQVSSIQSICFAGDVKQTNGYLTIEEEKDENNYIFTFNSNNSITTTFHFRKISENEIEQVDSNGFNSVFVKQ